MQVINLKGRKPQLIDEKSEVYIGRAVHMGGWTLTRSPWANPYSRKFGPPEACVAEYEKYIRAKPELIARLNELRGKKLACWCKSKPSDICHGDILIKLLQESAGRE